MKPLLIHDGVQGKTFVFAIKNDPKNSRLYECNWYINSSPRWECTAHHKLTKTTFENPTSPLRLPTNQEIEMVQEYIKSHHIIE